MATRDTVDAIIAIGSFLVVQTEGNGSHECGVIGLLQGFMRPIRFSQVCGWRETCEICKVEVSEGTTARAQQ